jgi:hypothetical protein
MLVAGALTFVLDTASQAFQLLMSIGAGTGLIYLLRWFWWRVNAWSEIAAMISSFAIALALAAAPRFGIDLAAHTALLVSVAATSVVWIAVTFLTAPTDRETLLAFYRRVQPAGPGWHAVRGETGATESPDRLPLALLGWVLGCAFVYSALFGTGSVLYGHVPQAILWAVVFLGTGAGLLRIVPQLWGAGHPS